MTRNHGDWDYWVVKLSSSGQLVWQKSLGGSTFDGAYGIINTTDGGCVVSGLTRSIDGDVTGNHGGTFNPNDPNSAEGTSGREDVWVVKLNSSGDLVWQKAYGGTGNDSNRGLVATSDGGYLLASTTTSTDGDVRGTYGQEDFGWLN